MKTITKINEFIEHFDSFVKDENITDGKGMVINFFAKIGVIDAIDVKLFNIDNLFSHSHIDASIKNEINKEIEMSAKYYLVIEYENTKIEMKFMQDKFLVKEIIDYLATKSEDIKIKLNLQE